MTAKRGRRKSFTRDITVVMVLIVCTVLGLAIFFAVQAKRAISYQYIENVTARGWVEFRLMTEAMESTLQLVQDWSVSGLLKLDDSLTLNDLLFPLLSREKLLYGVSIADTEGRNYYVRKMGVNYSTSETLGGITRSAVRHRLWAGDRTLLEDEERESDYDPRQRPWFSQAVAGERVIWTEPYIFYDSPVVGLTAAIRSKAAEEGGTLVVAFDILLGDLYQALQAFSPTANSRIFLFRPDAKLYIPPAVESSADFRAFDAVEDELVKRVHGLWSQSSVQEVFSIREGGVTWWCGFQPLDQTSRTVWLSVMVPENDITEAVKERRGVIFIFAAITLLNCAFIWFWLIGRHGHSTVSPADSFDPEAPEESIAAMLATGESGTVEFKSTIRMNLHRGQAGKEIEIAWLKGVAAFLNSDGGILLLGVNDNGEVVGLDADDFSNDDHCYLHCKNLLAAHIGAEFSQYVKFILVPIRDKKICVVQCFPSREPAFLKHSKGEGFFIRNGPSSDELPVSRVLDYIKARKIMI